MITVFKRTGSGNVEEARGIAGVALPAADERIWVDLASPSAEEAAILEDVFGFHPLAIEDCWNDPHSPKVDDYNDYVFIVVHGIRYEEEDRNFLTHELAIFMASNYLVTFHTQPSLSVASAQEQLRRTQRPMSDGMDVLLHYILDRLVDNYFPKLEILEEWIDELEAAAFKDPSEDVLTRIFETRRHITHLRRVVAYEREILVGMSRGTVPFISEKTGYYFRDVYDHMLRIGEMADVLRDTINQILQAYFSIVSHRLNDTMRVLTVIATIMLPMTVITGIYGMNFPDMPEMAWDYGYYYVLGGMALLSGAMLLYFRRRKWL